MSLNWIAEGVARWDAHKARIVGGVEPGVFNLGAPAMGELLPGEWWRVERDGQPVGYGWMDVTFGDGQILLCVAPEARGSGIGAYIIERLAAEARARGLARISNVVHPDHPHRARVTRWLERHGFTHARDDEQLVRSVR